MAGCLLWLNNMAYFPNSTSGMVLDEQCAACPVGRDPQAPCPILLVQSQFNYDQCHADHWKLREAMNALIDEKGICQMFKVFSEMPYSSLDELYSEFTGVVVPDDKPWYEKYISSLFNPTY